MKRVIGLGIAAVFLASWAVVSFAQNDPQEKGSLMMGQREQKSSMESSMATGGHQQQGGRKGPMMAGKGMIKRSMMMNKCPYMMMSPTLIATEDGGVVIMIANKLIKYDKDLNLVKETTIEIDIQKMHEEMMQKMSGGCAEKKDSMGQSAPQQEVKQ